MKMNVRSLATKLAAVVMLASAGVANAALSTDTTTAITASKADVLELGTAVFAVYLAIKTIKWVRRAL
jgi:uridylate kinase